ncbi:MFS transporter [Rhodococcus aetherivorans]|uniref:MFS transporter n=1 Tax=Rhodococcus aetherivorans TaxID=191292 RepID=UPI00366D6E4D
MIVAFMGIGVVSPILLPLTEQLGGTPSQVSLLFTGYMAVMGLAMLVTGAVSSRIGTRKTLLFGLFVIAGCALGASLSGTLGQIIGFRAGWGLGNALFVATALAAIVGAAAGGAPRVIVFYESAVGIGIATGPLVGGLLGQISWRAAFLGAAALMAVAFTLLVVLLPPPTTPDRPTPLLAPLRALGHAGLLSIALVSLLYHLGLFALFAYAPFVLELDPLRLGCAFCGWGVCVVISSVYVAPRLRTALGAIGATALGLALFAVTLAVVAVFTGNRPAVVACIVVSGLFLGVLNTLVTEIGMDAAPVAGSTAAAAYSFVRFGGGAVAPWAASRMGEVFNPHVPFAAAAGAVALALGVLTLGRRLLPAHHRRQR